MISTVKLCRTKTINKRSNICRTAELTSHRFMRYFANTDTFCLSEMSNKNDRFLLKVSFSLELRDNKNIKLDENTLNVQA